MGRQKRPIAVPADQRPPEVALCELGGSHRSVGGPRRAALGQVVPLTVTPPPSGAGGPRPPSAWPRQPPLGAQSGVEDSREISAPVEATPRRHPAPRHRRRPLQLPVPSVSPVPHGRTKIGPVEAEPNPPAPDEVAVIPPKTGIHAWLVFGRQHRRGWLRNPCSTVRRIRLRLPTTTQHTPMAGPSRRDPSGACARCCRPSPARSSGCPARPARPSPRSGRPSGRRLRSCRCCRW